MAAPTKTKPEAPEQTLGVGGPEPIPLKRALPDGGDVPPVRDLKAADTAREPTDALMDRLRHLAGCPAEEHQPGMTYIDPETQEVYPSRIEVIEGKTAPADVVAREGQDAGISFKLVRCVQCGEQYPPG